MIQIPKWFGLSAPHVPSRIQQPSVSSTGLKLSLGNFHLFSLSLSASHKNYHFYLVKADGPADGTSTLSPELGKDEL